MIRSLKKTRVSIVLTIALVICLNLAGLKNPIHYLTNEFLVEMFQVTNVNPMVGNSDIVIVNISDSSEEMIKDLIEVLSYYDPSVIAVDYFSADTANHAEADIPYRNLVLPALLENGSIVHSRNPFTKNASYGSIAVFSSLYFQPFVDYKDAKVPFMAVKIVELHDSIHYKRIAGLGTQKRVINYVGNVTSFMYLGDLTKIQSTEILEDIKGKVVLVGYTGINDPFPTEQDLFDAHSTPLGKMFGVGILANILHTLMGNMICDVPLFLMVLILFMLVLIGAWSVVFAVNRVRYSYWCIKAFQLLTVVLLFILASVLIHHAVLLDFELLVNALILLSEAAYWELKLLR